MLPPVRCESRPRGHLQVSETHLLPAGTLRQNKGPGAETSRPHAAPAQSYWTMTVPLMPSGTCTTHQYVNVPRFENVSEYAVGPGGFTGRRICELW